MNEKKLLILDDDLAIGKMISFIAEGMNFTVRYMADPVEFLVAENDWKPSHLAIDLIMPEMDGIQVLKELAQRGCFAQIIITSGSDDRILAAAGRSANERGLNIAGVLPKPFVPDSLRELLSIDGDMHSNKIHKNPLCQDVIEIEEPTVDELCRALAEDQFVIFYQPKVSCQDLSLSGFEALVRWNHPEHGIVFPDRFIPVVEKYGLIGELTNQVIEKSLRWFAMLSANYVTCDTLHACLTMSINLSARSLRDFHLVDRVTSLCQTLGVDPSTVIFELTETSAMDDPIASLDLLTRLRVKGFRLSIDDFGTGFSSALQLVRLPFSEIKIDKSFVMEAARSAESRAVIKSIVDLGHSLGLQTTAEGVEDAQALQFLKSIGCNHAQGYLFSRAIPEQEITGWIAGRASAASG